MKMLIRAVLAFFVLAVLPLQAGHAADLWKTVPPPAPLPKADESGLAPVNDIQMYYEIYNAAGADPVLLLHGGLGSTLNWGNQVPELMKTHKVVAVDSRGHGRSTRSEQSFGYELMASDVLAIMDHLKLDKVSIVGWSDGGIIGLVLAMQHPERVKKLFAYGANYNVSGVKPTVETDPVFGMAVGMAMENYRKLSPTPGEFDNFLKQIAAMWFSQPDFKPEQLGKIGVPTVIADGQYEEAIKPEHTMELAKMIPGAKLVIIPNVSHMGMWQDPAAINKAVMEFLDTM
ncbi:MAG: alpha/beta fold hydrolase [Hyphomicrobiales bacterium]